MLSRVCIEIVFFKDVTSWSQMHQHSEDFSASIFGAEVPDGLVLIMETEEL